MTASSVHPEGKPDPLARTKKAFDATYSEADLRERLSDEYKILQDKIDKIGGFRSHHQGVVSNCGDRRLGCGKYYWETDYYVNSQRGPVVDARFLFLARIRTGTIELALWRPRGTARRCLQTD